MSGREFSELDQELNKLEEEKLDKTKLINGPEDVYAQYFYIYGQMFRNYVDKLSAKASKRALKALIEYPLNEKDYMHTSEAEKNVILIGDKLLQAKQMMIIHVLSEQFKKEQQAKENQDGKTNDSGIGGKVEGQEPTGLHQNQE